MNIKHVLYYLCSIMCLFIFSCAGSPARNMITSGELSATVSIAVEPPYYILPIPCIGIQYGFSDDVNIGLNLYPAFVLMDIILIEPYGVFHFLDQNEGIPGINAYVSGAAAFYMDQNVWRFSSTCGLLPYWQIDDWKFYGIVEGCFDFGDTDIFSFSPHINSRVGVEFSPWWNSSIELGFASIGEYSSSTNGYLGNIVHSTNVSIPIINHQEKHE